MQITLRMPSLSPSMTEGTLLKWQKREGDRIFAGDVIAEIETDKAVIEFEAADEGILSKILVADGTEGVPVDEPIALLLTAGDQPSAAAAATASAASGAVVSGSAIVGDAAPVGDAPPAGDAGAQPRAEAGAAAGARIVVSPIARRLAEEYGLDLAAIQGTGPGGRIGKEDVEAARQVAAAGAGRAPAASAGTAPAASAAAPAPGFGPKFHAVPNSAKRKVIARRLSESKQQTPHFYLTIDCRVDALLASREEINAGAGEPKLSVNDFVIRAVALALRAVPAANASWTEAAILQYEEVDISVAVATPEGLITPIIRQADGKDLHQISAEIRALAQRAQDVGLKPEEFQGGGFTVSNLGMFGVREFSAIINPPQGCILAVGACEPRAIVVDGRLAVGSVMSCTLSVDHRVVDGALGAEFLRAFKARIEDPSTLRM